jgi:hypothetical protein
MNRAQKRLIANLISAVVIITVFIFSFGNFKDYVNKSEALRAFKQLGQEVLDYRKQTGQLPSESMIANLKEQLEGSARVGNIEYRAQYISIDSPPATIVAYSEKEYHWLIKSGFVVLLLDGRVLYMSPKDFNGLLAKQRTAFEAEQMKKSQKPLQGFQ